jgi:ADP-ribosylation factor-binding protein GGA
MMVKQDEIKSEKISSRINELDRINSSIKLLDDMLVNFSGDTSGESGLDTMKCIHDELDKFKPLLIKLANETDDNDEGIGEIIKTNDNLIRCLNDYSRVLSGGTLEKPKHEDDTFLINTQIDLTENPIKNEKYDPFKELKDLFSAPEVSTTLEDAKKDEILAQFDQNINLILASTPSQPLAQTASSTSNNKTTKNLLEDQFELLDLSNPYTKQIPKPPSLNELQKISNPSQSAQQISINIDTLSIPLNSIKPSSQAPKTLIDKNNIKIVLHIARESPAPYVYVFVVSITSLNEYPLSKFSFQASVPTNMKIKLQQASSTELPSYNPILPLSAITQVMLVANPMQDKLKIVFKLNYTMNGTSFSENGEVNDLTVINEIL